MRFIGYGDGEIDATLTYNYYMTSEEEEWKQIFYKGIPFHYEVSNKGRVRNMYNKKIISTTKTGNSDNENDYRKVSIKSGHDRYTVNVHRLVATAFIKVPKKYKKMGLDNESLYVNHKDGVKWHNVLYNLEWCTPKENSEHAIRTGLSDNLRGENNSRTDLTNDEARRICEMLEEGYTNNDIAKLLGVSENIPHEIKTGRTWSWLSKDYDIKRIKETVPYKYTEETVIGIADDLKSGKMTGRAIAKKWGVDTSYVSMVLHKRIRPELLTEYDFTKRKNIPKRQNEELLKNMCQDLQNRISVKDIMNKYEVSMSFVSEVKHRKIRPDISENYVF